MRERNIQIEPFQFLNISKLEIQKEPGQHPVVYIEGILADTVTDADVEQQAGARKLSVSVLDDSGASRILFRGLIDSLEVHTENGVKTISVRGIANTNSMDIKKRTRTFQMNTTKYKRIVECLESDDKDFGVLIQEHGDEKIGRMLIQYDETDWEFANRVASRLNTVVIPNCTLNIPYISIGPTHSSKYHEITPVSYALIKDVGTFEDCRENGVPVTERDIMCYKVVSREIFDLCDNVTFQGRKLLVYSVSTQLKGDELYHTYILKVRDGFCQKEYFNSKFVGAALEGTVLDVERDEIRITFSDDQGGHKLFPYATVYSSPDGTGWYFMPEPGDSVRLQFPTEREEDAYAISSVHVSHGRRNDPDTKFIRTKYGKQVLFRPGSISISDGHGSSIVLSDDDGIRIESDESITFSAEDNVTLSGWGKVLIKGDEGVTITQNASIIRITDTIDLTSSHTRMR